nr:type II secretion system secretin GspD [Oceanococcus sp. HetDA_MAG_MS8]
MILSTTLRRLCWALALSIPLQVAAQNSGGTTLNLKDADIASLITTVSDLTGTNFIVDPRVKGKVTVLSSAPMSPEELYSVFLAVLQVHGFAAVPAGPVTKIVPEVGAKQDGGSYFEFDGLAEDEIVTRVVEIANVPAAQLVPILRPLVPQYGHLAAYSPSNMLIISDRAANVARLTQIIERIDRSSNSELEVIRLEYASATDVERLVQGLYQGNKAAAQAAGQDPVVVLADERTNSILVSGDPSQRVAIRALVAHLDIPLDEDGDTQVIYLSFANSETLAPILEGYVESQQQGQAGGQGGQAAAGNRGGSRMPGTRIVAEPDINALVITAPPKIMRGLKSVIAQLDIRRSQVLVEAILAEISVNKARQLGVDWAVFNDEQVAAAGILDQSVIGGLGGALGGQGGSAAALSLVRQGLNIAGGRENSNGTTFGVLLRALSSDGDTNVLSTPSVVTMDNEEAEISVGQEVPFLTGSFSNAGGQVGAVNPFQTIERRDVGLTLAITPQINAGDNIQLEIRQESSDVVAGGGGGAVDLVTNKRTLNTTVMVDDGDILVLGGLINDNVNQTEQKIPILGDIPLIGALFRSTSVNRDKQNLMIFIRPTILRDRATASFHTNRKYRYMRNVQRQANEEGTRLFWNDNGPQLNPLEEMIRPKVLETLPGANGESSQQDTSPVTQPQAKPANQALQLDTQLRSDKRVLSTEPVLDEPAGRVDAEAPAERKKMGRGHLR